MRWGVTYAALVFNLVFTLELFLASRNLLALLLAVPIHGISALLCAHDARFFGPAAAVGAHPIAKSAGEWTLLEASTYSPLNLSMGQRQQHEPTAYTVVVARGECS